MIPQSLSRTVIAVVLISSLSVLLPRKAGACGPFFSNAIFVYSKHPDFPLERFAAGQIGVLQPNYARSYLVAAYRNLIGEKLSIQEVAALKGLWDERLNYGGEIDDTDWIKKWNDTRAKVPGAAAVQISAFRSREKPHEYETYVNCQEDAFANAEATLNERIKRFGADSPNVREWLKAQDTVFSNCREGAQMPEAAPADADSLMRADRAYQIAAAHFYAAQFDEAAKAFDAIAHDSASPWRDVAAYLAARALLRKGSLADKEEGRPFLAEAENRLQAIINDKSLTRSHHAATRLLNLTRLRLRPEEKLHELSQAIVKKGPTEDFKQTVWDYTVLLDKYLGEEVKLDAVPQAIKGDDLTDWILTFQDGSATSASHAVERWQATQQLPWLVAAIAKVTSREPKVNALLAAAAKVDRGSTAFPSLAFHTVRLLIEANRLDEARNFLDRTLAPDRKNLTPSGVNLLLGQRMTLSQNLEEFLQNAQRMPAGFSDNNDGREIPEENESEAPTDGPKIFFDWDAANVFNRLMPSATLGEAARSQSLTANLHRDVVQAAFMRAALIDDRATANQTATTLASAYPELKEFLASYQRATTPDARRFAAAYLALKFPGLRPYVTVGLNRTGPLDEIDSFRDNWWCGEPPNAYVQDEGAKTEPLTAPLFLKTSQSVATREAAAISALGTGPNYLAQTAITWGTKNPADARVPEALHLAVKSTRYGCTDKETGRWSKAAFDFLHRRYPNTSWAKETKYWFKG
jgi:hypothetical protein